MTAAAPISAKKLAALPAVMALAMILALAGGYGAFAIQAPWGMPVFASALAIGFGVQIWFVAKLVSRGRP